MLVIAFIGTFIMGAAAMFGLLYAFAKWLYNMSSDEIAEFVEIGVKAGHNRTSTITLCTDDGDTDFMILEDK